MISINNRSVNGSNCPYCDLTPQSKQELTITFELIKFFKDINPKGFKTRVTGKHRKHEPYKKEASMYVSKFICDRKTNWNISKSTEN